MLFSEKEEEEEKYIRRRENRMERFGSKTWTHGREREREHKNWTCHYLFLRSFPSLPVGGVS